MVGEPPGQGGPLHSVVLAQVLEEGGGLEEVEVGHPGGHLPVQGGGDLMAGGVDGVVELHMPGGDGAGAVRLPHPQGVLAEVAVHLVAEGHAQGGGWDHPPECGHHLVILPVDLSSGYYSAHSGTSPMFNLEHHYIKKRRPGQAGGWD